MRTSTMLPATMNAAELLRHYATQLESAGWRSATTRGESAIGSWTLADTSGVRDLTLEVFERGTLGIRCFDVQMGVSERAR